MGIVNDPMTLESRVGVLEMTASPHSVLAPVASGSSLTVSQFADDSDLFAKTERATCSTTWRKRTSAPATSTNSSAWWARA